MRGCSLFLILLGAFGIYYMLPLALSKQTIESYWFAVFYALVIIVGIVAFVKAKAKR